MVGSSFPPRYAPLKISASQLFSDDRRAFDERGELVLHHPARRLPESAIRIEPELLGRDVFQNGAEALGHDGPRLRLARLDADHAGAELLLARELLRAAEILQAGVRELEA